MKFKELEKDSELVSKIKETYYKKEIGWDKRIDMMLDLVSRSVSERSMRKWLVKLGIKDKVDVVPEQIEVAKQKVHNKTKKYYLITSAQNATTINHKLWVNMQAYAKKLDAEILVIPFRYHNPTSITSNKKDDWWNPELVPHLTLNRHNLNNKISVLADIKIQPTAPDPLSSLESMTGSHSSIVGHPKIELKQVAGLDSSNYKFIFSSGCCTNENFLDSKAGKKASFHFSPGFALVEIKDEDTFFFRQVAAQADGQFIDMFYHVKDGNVNRVESVDAAILGDVHCPDTNIDICNLVFNGLFKKLYPKSIFMHDIISANSISYHNLKDPFYLHKLFTEGNDSLQEELDKMIEWLKFVEPYNSYIVKSNHERHIDDFLKSSDWKRLTTFKNAIPYMEYSLAMLKGEAKNGVVPYVVNKHYPKIKCLTEDDNIVVNGYLLSQHGHASQNGAKGSTAAFSNLGVKAVIGHQHTTARKSGCCVVGTFSGLRLNYNRGLSSWSNSMGIINKLGKFQHIIFWYTKDGIEYTTIE